MADVKISALPAATTPLGGTELVPIVQGGVTTRVSVDNLTAGRTLAASTVNVDANTASAAVRITQTGAGNALLVEDSANPDATPFVVTSTGNVGIGTTSPSAPLTVKAESAGYVGIRVLEAAGVASTIQFVNDPVSAERGSFIATASGNMRMYGTSTAEFYTGGLERMRILATGEVAVGGLTTTGGYPLGVQAASSSATIRIFGRSGDDISTWEFANYAQTVSQAYIQSAPSYFQIAVSGTPRIHIAATNGEVGIGTTSPNAAALLDVNSTTKGFLPPRMTTTQRDAIASPPNGLVLYNSTTDKLQVRAAGSWVDLH